MLLTKIEYAPPRHHSDYPFNLPWQADFHELTLTSPVTILTGDNGSGKSTLLNAIAANYNAILMSGAALEDDPEYDNSRALARHLKLTWTYRTKAGFFFRADDFISFIRATRGRIKYAQTQLERLAPQSLERLRNQTFVSGGFRHFIPRPGVSGLISGAIARQRFIFIRRARISLDAGKSAQPVSPDSYRSRKWCTVYHQYPFPHPDGLS